MKRLSLFIITLSLSFVPSAILLQTYRDNFMTCCFKNFDIEEDAAFGIQKVLNEECKKPYFVERTYHIEKDKVVVKTKSHYSEYRKKPFVQEEVFKTSFVNPDDIDIVAKFIYKNTDKDHLTRINKKAKKSKRHSTKIAFNRHCDISRTLYRV